jgi:class 3 adenylate cyclase
VRSELRRLAGRTPGRAEVRRPALGEVSLTVSGLRRIVCHEDGCRMLLVKVGTRENRPISDLMAICRTCGSELPEAARYCPACGAAVEGRLGEERKMVTVLFADLVDSTATADERDPEDVRAALRPQVARMREELERFGGTFEKYIGDAVMAVFGAPVAHEDDPERAVRAALAIRDALPGVRGAVHTGEAVVSLAAAS